ncbi:peptidase T [Pirellulaceae bacterium SH467]|jgi:tripeptide aminopeptidase
MSQRDRLIERFLEYVCIDTTANPDTDRYPSSDGQRLLGTRLRDELATLGLEQVEQDEHGLVWAWLPGNVVNAPAILLNAHLDTSPEASGKCNPNRIDRYDGGRIELASGDWLSPENTPELASLSGHTLITTDGTSLLGGDDKAGVAAIMEIVHRLVEKPSLPHGPVQVLFTCDEEIGRGTSRIQREQIRAVAGYTLDGGGAGTIDEETFSADLATVRFLGRNTHPSVGKGKMINALRGAAHFLSMMPAASDSPESTDGREGFMHPYHFEGGVAEAKVQVLLRSFDTAMLSNYANLLKAHGQSVARSIPGLSVHVEVTEQYRNMADGIRRRPETVTLAEKAFKKCGYPFRRDRIRGGTDGALLTAMGIPTPNLSVGQYNIHSTREFASIDQIEQAIEHGICLLGLWSICSEMRSDSLSS